MSTSCSRFAKRFTAVLVSLLLGIGAAVAEAAPNAINFQGQVLDADRAPISGPVGIEIGIFDAEAGGLELYHEAHPGTPLVNGVYSILIGAGANPTGVFDAAAFAEDGRWLEVVIDGETLTPRQPFTSVAYAFRAQEADHAATSGDADTVDGIEAAALDQSDHVGRTDNPHRVTAAHTAGEVATAITTHAGNPSAHHIKTTSFAELVDQAADGQIPASITRDTELAALQGTLSALQSQISALDTANTALQSQVAALQDLFQHFSRSGNDVFVTGANLHIVSGSGSTTGPVNGLGNLIVGYNELLTADQDRTGSHNLVVGSQHSYSSYGGIVGGLRNTISAPHASVVGGHINTANSYAASVSGGMHNVASGLYASVLGGKNHTASGDLSSISGGNNNTASGALASVSGGQSNTASGWAASVGGGTLNTASGGYASVSGGRNNLASGSASSVAGGGGPDAADGNVASAEYSTLSGTLRVYGDLVVDDPANIRYVNEYLNLKEYLNALLLQMFP